MKLFNPNFVNPLFAALGLLFVAWMLVSSVATDPSEGCNRGRNFVDRGDSPDRIGGIALKFQSWPAAKDEMSLIQEMEEQGLVRTNELPYVKVWVFRWCDKRFRDFISTHMICKRLKENTDTLEYCDPLIASPLKFNRTDSL